LSCSLKVEEILYRKKLAWKFRGEQKIVLKKIKDTKVTANSDFGLAWPGMAWPSDLFNLD
jgi:hypothetical protein